MNKNQIFELFNQWGFNITDESSYIELFSVVVIIFSVIALWCSIDILVYWIIIKILENKILLEKVSAYPFLLKVINYSKKIRWWFILINALILIYCLIAMIYFSFQILIHLK